METPTRQKTITRSQRLKFHKTLKNIMWMIVSVTFFGASRAYAQMPVMPGMVQVNAESRCQAYVYKDHEMRKFAGCLPYG